MVEKKDVLEVLKECYDPEIPVNVVDLGLIDEIEIENGNVKIKIVPTSLACPMLHFIIKEIEEKVKKLDNVKNVDVKIVTDKVWTPERVKESIRKKLGWE